MKNKILIIAIILLLAGTLLVVERAQAQICEPGHHGNYGCMEGDDDIDRPQPEKPAETATPTATLAPIPTATITPTPNFCSIHGCY